jgi:hypothetical protein
MKFPLLRLRERREAFYTGFSSTWQFIVARVEKVFLWPFVGGVTAVLGVYAGYLGSASERHISTSRCVVGFSENCHYSSEATTFWSVVFLFGASFTLTAWAQIRTSGRTSAALSKTSTTIDERTSVIQRTSGEIAVNTGQLVDQVRVVEGLVQRLHTLPPRGFLEVYREMFDASWKEATQRRGGYESSIRIQLKNILLLLQRLEHISSGARYAANVMLFVETKDRTREELGELRARLHFVEETLDMTRIPGVLDLQPPMSVASDSDGERDPHAFAFALSVPSLDAEEAEKLGLLSGAPASFVHRTPWVFEAAGDVAKIGENQAFTLRVRQSIVRFFAEHRDRIKSFACYPLFVPPGLSGQESPDDKMPFGVLNVHRDKENFLSAEQAMLVAPILAPFLTLLSASILSGNSDVAIMSDLGEPDVDNQNTSAPR